MIEAVNVITDESPQKRSAAVVFHFLGLRN